jgi:hypothetical protein
MKKISINGKDYNIKYTIRSLFIFEQITGKSFAINTLLDNYVFFYSMLIACNSDDVLTWDEFIDALDADPTILKQMNDVVEEQQKQSKVFNQEDENGDVKKN